MDSVQIEGFDRREYNAVILAALLHDIGKFLHRKDEQTYKVSHQETGASFIKEIGEKARSDQLYDIELIEFLVRHHHSTLTVAQSDKYLIKSKTTEDRLGRLLRVVKDADSYSCSERDQDEEARKNFADRHEPLKPIFLNINLGDAKKAKNENDRYRLHLLNPFLTFPDEFGKLKDEEISGLIGEFKQKIPDVSNYQKFDDVLNKWVDVLQRYTWAVPSDTRYKGPDVSLYDHLRSSAAFAACLYKRHIASINTGGNFERKNEFILIGGDYSGIQDYIFDITNRGSGGASKRLRARSFFIHLFSETTIHKILHTLDLPFVCNLFSAGGKFLLLAPNNDFTPVSLNQVKFEIEREISTTYFNQFSFLISWMAINGYNKRGNDFEIKSFYKSADDMFHRLETEKLGKFRSILVNKSSDGAHWNIDAFKANEMYQKYEGVGDCQICGRGPGIREDRDSDTGEITRTCQICHRDKYQIGQELPKVNYLAFGRGFSNSENEDKKILIFKPVEGENGNSQEGYYVELLKEYKCAPEHYLVCSLREQVKDNDQKSTKPIVKEYYASHVPWSQADSTKIASFEEIAERSRWKKDDKDTYGSDLLGVLKADIDNLGLIFSKGFVKPGKSEDQLPDVDRRTVSRFLTLSRMIDLFFSGWINTVMAAPKEEIIKQLLTMKGVDAESFCKYLRNDTIDFNNIYTVYSGGDDLVLVGPWETMIIFSIFLNMQFRRYSCNNDYVTLSAGLAFVKERHPIASAIKQADELLETSKKNGKDSITLFGTTIKWEILPQLINCFLFLDRKLNEEEPEINMSFIYRLLGYHNIAMDYIDNQSLTGLKYISVLSYDLGRNVVKWDKNGVIIKGRETYNFMQDNIIKEKPDSKALIYGMKTPLFWALYRNRRSSKNEDISNI